MKIGGFQKISLIDFPERIAAVIFTQGCNLRCPYCQNPDLIETTEITPVSVDTVWQYLSLRKKQLDGVTITGGEPLIQKDIRETIKEIKNLGYEVKIDTNGTLPETLKKLIADGNVDYIAMDIKAPPQNYSEIVGKKISFEPIRKSIETIMKNNISYEFRSTLVPGFHNEKMVEEMAKLITGAERYVLQNLSGYRTLDPEYSKLSPFNIEMMKHFQSIASQYVKTCTIRGGDAVGSLNKFH